MVKREELRLQGLRAYEVGRLRMASRVAWLLVPLTALCLVEVQGRRACLCLALPLLFMAVWLRWRDRAGFESVHTGLMAGSLPLLAGVTLDQLGLQCSLAGGASFCSVFAVLIGVAAGAWIGRREGNWSARIGSGFTAVAIAVLAAGLGCVRLGVLGFAGVAAGIALGSLAAVSLARQR